MADIYGIYRDPKYGGIYRRHARQSPVLSAQTLSITFNAGLTLTPTVDRAFKHLLALDATETLTGQLSINRQQQRAVDVIVTFASSLARRTGFAIGPSLVMTPIMPMTKKLSRIMTIFGVITPGMFRYGKQEFILPVTLVLNPVQVKMANRSVSAGLSLSPGLTRVRYAYRALDASGTLSVALARPAIHPRALTTGLTGQMAMGKAAVVSLSAGVNFATVMTYRSVRVRVFNYTLDTQPIMNRIIQMRLAPTFTMGPLVQLGRSQFMTLDGTLQFFNSLEALSPRMRTFSVELVFDNSLLLTPVTFTRLAIPITKLVAARLPDKYMVRAKAR